MNYLVFLSILLLLLTTTISATTTKIGVTYTTTTYPPTFAYTNISFLLTVPNPLITLIFSAKSSTHYYFYTKQLPFHQLVRICLINLRSDTSGLAAVENDNSALIELAIKSIPVSTFSSFITAMYNSSLPSGSEFIKPVGSLVVNPLLKFMEETNSLFCVNAYLFNVYRFSEDTPVGFVLFYEFSCNFRIDLVTGVRFGNLFVDGVVAALAVSGKEGLPVVVTDTGWHSDGSKEGVYADMYLRELVRHLKSGVGMPLRKDRVSETYLYQLFDDVAVNGTKDDAGKGWGIMHQNMTQKYSIDLSDGSLVIKLLLNFLQETNLSFCVNVYSFNLYRVSLCVNVYPFNVYWEVEEISVGFALFEEFQFNFRDDLVTGVRDGNLLVGDVIDALAVWGEEGLPVGFALFDQFWFDFRDDLVTGMSYGNLFDMMVDGVVALAGKEGLTVAVAETGWRLVCNQARQTLIVRGLFPMLADPRHPAEARNATNESILKVALDYGKACGVIKPRDRVVVCQKVGDDSVVKIIELQDLFSRSHKLSSYFENSCQSI